MFVTTDDTALIYIANHHKYLFLTKNLWWLTLYDNDILYSSESAS